MTVTAPAANRRAAIGGAFHWSDVEWAAAALVLVEVNGERMIVERDAESVRDAIRGQAALWAPRFRGDVPCDRIGRERPTLRPELPDHDVACATGAFGFAIYSQVLPPTMTSGDAFIAGFKAGQAWCAANPWPEPPPEPRTEKLF